ncbi:hypothetical protein KIN20_031915 [Parelaphostrongylus tenuis]|uniref:Uncharacterized protein n=1 Tax=Parelaphostrongylus tenuis TaxID=148309 RepID=A0AAD5R6A1_PARTN|nr:hypothetical protein KIN20_031915 [Parelaphostrongylus tenuis]
MLVQLHRMVRIGDPSKGVALRGKGQSWMESNVERRSDATDLESVQFIKFVLGLIDSMRTGMCYINFNCTYNAGVLSMPRFLFLRKSGLYVAPSQLRWWKLNSTVAFEELTPLLKLLFN